MAEKKPQTYENHGKIVTGYHYVAVPILGLYILWTAWAAISAFSVDAVVDFLVAIALFLVAFYARIFPLKVQDRLIRHEELKRMDELLSEPAKARVGDIPPSLFVALRFASDEELEDLAARVADRELTDRKAIKQAIKTWRPDTFRV